MIIQSDLFQNTEHRKLGGNTCNKLFLLSLQFCTMTV